MWRDADEKNIFVVKLQKLIEQKCWNVSKRNTGPEVNSPHVDEMKWHRKDLFELGKIVELGMREDKYYPDSCIHPS